MPENLLVAQVTEVAAISTMLTAPEGVPVMEKLLTAEFVVRLTVKKAGELAGFCSFTVISILTPPGGIGLFNVTTKGKSGPGAAG